MEPRDRPAQAMTGGVEKSQKSVPATTVWRFRWFTCCLVLAALAFMQRPGLVTGDTKLDLTVDPGAFLRRAVFMWDPEGAFGQVQNQAYGYLFPMGPFYWLGALADIPAWAVQRGWLSLVLITAFLGIIKLASVLSIGSPLSRTVAAFAFALSPRFLTTLGPISIEAWPSAVTPWVMVPLVIGLQGGSPRKAAALSALAIACVGGVNAAATAAVLPLAALWLLLQKRTPARRQLMLWWPLLTLLGTLWWLVPLFLLGKYSPPFLDYIESAGITTFPTTLFDSLRGTSDWIAYVDPDLGAGNSLLTEWFLIVDVAVVVALGLMGLAERGNPHRGFLVSGLMVGLIMVTTGHLGEVQGWFAQQQREWLDAALAPLRNVHKYDVVLRLPLVLGLAHLLAPTPNHELLTRKALFQPAKAFCGIAIIAVVGSATPALTGSLTPAGAFLSVPGYWSQTAAWLARHDDGTRALLLPGSSFGDYIWGNPRDEPMQALASSPWAVRNAIPLAPSGNIRMLDAGEARIATGEGSSGLAPYLARAGVRYLVVRNDLAQSDDVPDPVVVHQALADSPGIARVVTFGPQVGGDSRLEGDDGQRVIVNQAWQAVYPAVEIFEVDGAAPAADHVGNPMVVAGGPEDLLELADLGVLDDRPTILATDAGRDMDYAQLVLTDGLRRRTAAFGRVHRNLSATLTEAQSDEVDRAAREYLLGDGVRWTSVRRLTGAKRLDASSSMSDAESVGGAQREYLPFAAFDGDPETAWVSGFDNGSAGPWLEISFSQEIAPSKITVVLDDEGGRLARQLVITTDEDRVVSARAEPGESRIVALSGQPTNTLRISVAQGKATYGSRLAISDVSIPSVDIRHPLVLPTLPASWDSPDTVVMSADDSYRSGCLRINAEVRCAPGRGSLGEDGFTLDRIVPMSHPQLYDATLRSAPRPGAALDSLIQEDRLVHVEASSQTVVAPVGGPLAAIDGDRGTSWIADPDDVNPTFTLSWLRERRLDTIRLSLGSRVAAVPATQVELRYPGGTRMVQLNDQGRGRFPAMRTDQLTIRFVETAEGYNLPFEGGATPLAVGVSEISVVGVPEIPSPLSSLQERLGCGTGPTVTVNGKTRSVEITASKRDLYLGNAVETRLCGGSQVDLAGGDNEVLVMGNSTFRPEAFILSAAPYGAEPSSALSGGPVAIRSEDPTHRVLQGRSRAGVSTLVMRENVNPGWRATSDGKVLSAVTIDGWQQGWLIPAGEGGVVRAEFSPGTTYQVGLSAGAAGLLALIALALWPGGARREQGTTTRTPRFAARAVLAIGAMGLVAGWSGALTMGVTVVAVVVFWARRPNAAPPPGFARWLLLVPFSVAVLSYVLRPWGSPEGWAGDEALPQLAVILTLSFLLTSVVVDPNDTAFKRIKGFSKNR